MAKSKSMGSSKSYYAQYDAKYAKNRAARLERHIKAHPEDKTALHALGSISYRRKKPNKKGGWMSAPVSVSTTDTKGKRPEAEVLAMYRGKAYCKSMAPLEAKIRRHNAHMANFQPKNVAKVKKLGWAEDKTDES
jgi:uncharacterized protein HemY